MQHPFCLRKEGEDAGERSASFFPSFFLHARREGEDAVVHPSSPPLLPARKKRRRAHASMHAGDALPFLEEGNEPRVRLYSPS